MRSLSDYIKSSIYADETEKQVVETFERVLNEFSTEGWRTEHNVWVPLIDGTRFEVDLIILKGNSPVAVVEIKQSLSHKHFSWYSRIEERLRRAALVLYSPLCIVCSPNEMYSFSVDDLLVDSGTRRIIENFDSETIKAILELEDSKDSDSNSSISAEDIKEKWLKDVLKEFQFETKKDVITFIKDLADKDVESEFNAFSLTEEKEDGVFKALLGEYTKDYLCRFTTMNSIFRTCNERMQSMCCIVCMNDKSETDYAAQKLNDTMQSDSDEINGCYIMSCCDIDSKDNFTMWRLYGDDAKGVCIEYQKKEFTNDFYFAPISYAKDSKQTHPELDFIRKLQDIEINGKRFKLNHLSIWKHFFKPYEYRDEKEIRLLFNKKCAIPELNSYGDANNPPFKRMWIYNGDYSIISPIVAFSVEETENNFPLLIDRITIGPKAKEADVNVEQLDYLIKVKNIAHTNKPDIVTKSAIKHYR